MEFKKTLNKDIVVVILLLIIQFIFSETYDFMTSQSCSTSRDCPESKNLICLHVYEGCHRGYCACHPHNSTNDKSGNCVPLLHWGDICEPGFGECRRPMTCEGGRCRCPQGYHMVKDGKHCLEKSARLVGQRCLNHEGRHRKCYRETTDSTGFTQNDVTCSISTGTCVCNEGFKTLGHQCLTRRLGDHGCRTSIHCEGGAVCSDGRCVCPTGYMPDDNFYKCLRLNAETNIELGGSCDEVNENRYCAPGFVCYRCAEEIQDKCIRFLLSTEYGISKAHAMSANIVVVVIFIIEQFMSPFATVISRILNC